MFFERLMEARQEAVFNTEQKATATTASTTTISTAAVMGGSRNGVTRNSPGEGLAPCVDKEDGRPAGGEVDDDDDCEGGEQSIVHKVSEFLFDVFDANQMEEYKVIADFEHSACAAFDTDSEEYTLEQKRLHERFSELIEGIVTDYLLQEGYTLETFYEEVKACKEKKGSDEVSDVLWLVVDFREWAREMRRQAAQRRKYQRDKAK